MYSAQNDCNNVWKNGKYIVGWMKNDAEWNQLDINSLWRLIFTFDLLKGKGKTNCFNCRCSNYSFINFRMSLVKMMNLLLINKSVCQKNKNLYMYNNHQLIILHFSNEMEYLCLNYVQLFLIDIRGDINHVFFNSNTTSNAKKGR